MERRVKEISKPGKSSGRVAEGNGGAAAAAAGPVPEENGARPIGAAEKLLLGLPPTASVTAVPRALRGLIRGDGAAARLEVVQVFLARHPDLREDLEREAGEIWKRVSGKPEEFTAAVAERRARLLSLAQLSNVNETAPVAVQNTYTELARYLAESYGAGGSG
jgi:hypothetical protein